MNQRGSHLLTLCDVQIRCQKLYWRVWSVFLICHCVSHHSSYSFNFLVRSNIVVIYILHELVYSARLFMKMASWGFVFQCLSLPGSFLIALRRQNVAFRAIPEPDLLWGALHPLRRLLALRHVLPWNFLQVCSISVLLLWQISNHPI